MKLVEFLFAHPLTDIQTVEKHLGVVYNTAAALIRRFERADLLTETTGRRRNRVYRFSAYLDLFDVPASYR